MVIQPSVGFARPSFAVAVFDVSGRRLISGIDRLSRTVSAGTFSVGVSAAVVYDPSVDLRRRPGWAGDIDYIVTP